MLPMPLSLSLSGQNAIITGGAGGIGKATARLLAQAGAHVAILDVNAGAGQELAAELGDRAIFVACNMAKLEQIDRAYAEVITHLGHIDILVNNVGVWMPGGNILEMSDDIIAQMEAVNVTGPRHLTRLTMNDMRQRQQPGCVTFVSSTQAHVIDGEPTIYNVQKNTVLGMVKAFAIAGGPFGIRVNAVSPGAISTEGMGAANAVGKERIFAGNHKTPLGRRGTPKEVAQEIVHLCFATYTTGDNRTVDGGFSKVALPASLTPHTSVQDADPDKLFLAGTSN
jgi:NAD(P)-dependent dehydrogenase (short-subunit alcohol dehydrogenase family)